MAALKTCAMHSQGYTVTSSSIHAHVQLCMIYIFDNSGGFTTSVIF